MGQDTSVIREEIERTRERVGDEVDALSYKTDVGARVGDYVDDKKEAVKSTVTGAKDAVTGVEEDAGATQPNGKAEQPKHHHGVPESGFGRVPEPGQAQDDRPLVGTAEMGGVIDPDVLWSCTSCGAWTR